jgi:hypothetical protein
MIRRFSPRQVQMIEQNFLLSIKAVETKRTS